MAIENEIKQTASGKWQVYINGVWGAMTSEDKEEPDYKSLNPCPKCKSDNVYTKGQGIIPMMEAHEKGELKYYCRDCKHSYAVVNGVTTIDVDYEEIKDETKQLPLTNLKQLRS